MPSNIGTPGNIFSLVGRLLNPSVIQTSDGLAAEVALGRHQQLFVDDVHGPYHALTNRGRTWSAQANAATGRTILAAGGTTSGFMFYNPASSGVNMEIIEIVCLPLTATDVVGVIGLESGAPPTTVANAATPVSNFSGGTAVTNKCLASYGSTIVAMTFLKWLPIFVQTTAGVLQGSSGIYNPWGSLVIAPGGAINIVSSSSQSTNLWAQSVTWAEYPI